MRIADEWKHEFRREIANLWRIRREKNLSGFIEGNYRLSFETEADPGDYNLAANPYWREVIDAAGDRFVRRITILKSTQVGGTITAQGIMMALAAVDPAPAMVVLPTKDEAVKQRDRIYGNALESRTPISKLVPGRQHWNTRSIDLGASQINIAFSGSPQRLRGKPCKRVYLTETDVYEYEGDAGNPHQAAEQRVKQFYEYLIFEESTPVGEDSHIYHQWAKSQRRRWYCPCPHCGLFQELRFFTHKKGEFAGRGGLAGFTDEAGNLLEPDVAERNAYYVCLNGCRIDSHFKNSMVKRGVWVAEGQSVVNGVVSGEPDKSGRHIGFHIWTIMQHKISLGILARNYVEHANDNNLRDFFQNWLGLQYQASKSTPPYNVVGMKYRASPEYTAGHVPRDVWFLTAGADVQLDQLYWVVLGWRPLRTPYLIDWGEIFRDRAEIAEQAEVDESDDNVILASDLAKLPETVLNRAWPSSGNPFGFKEMQVRLLACDTNYRTQEVHHLAHALKNPRFRCVRGDDKVTATEKFKMSVVERNSRTGKLYDGGLELWSVYKRFYQDAITERLNAAPDQAGTLRFPSNVTNRGTKLLKQLCNVRKNAKGHYEMISDSIGRDFRDCMGYAEAAADMVVGRLGWSEQAWADWRARYLAQQQTQADRGSGRREAAPRSILER